MVDDLDYITGAFTPEQRTPPNRNTNNTQEAGKNKIEERWLPQPVRHTQDDVNDWGIRSPLPGYDDETQVNRMLYGDDDQTPRSTKTEKLKIPTKPETSPEE